MRLWQLRMHDEPPLWQSLVSAAIRRKHAGDVSGAIRDLEEAIRLMRALPNLTESTATKLNFLADLYLRAGNTDSAENAIREAIEFSPHVPPQFHADNLLVLAEVLVLKGESQDAIAAGDEAVAIYRQHCRNLPARVAEVEAMVESIKAKKPPAS